MLDLSCLTTQDISRPFTDVPHCLDICIQALRVTQEQHGALKLEAYMRLLQELLLIQLQQASITHPGTSQVCTCL